MVVGRGSFDSFSKKVSVLVDDFKDNQMLRKLETKSLTIDNYHVLLSRLFHQVYNSSSSFALAAARTPIGRWQLKEYLFKHAEEEKTHWRWITSDLKNSGYRGEPVESSLPASEALAYIAFNFYIAETCPEGRLAIASVLEGIGAKYGEYSARLLSQNLDLKKDQMSFLTGHGEADIAHTEEIFNLLKDSNLSSREWEMMELCAETGFKLYSDLFRV